MTEFLYNIDRIILIWIHQEWRNPILDVAFVWLHESKHFVIPLALIWLYLIIFGGRRGRILALLLAIGLVLTDQISSHLLKPLVGRERPCFALDEINALVHQVHSRSFPSSHATNNFGAATILWQVRRGPWVWWMVVAALVAISRVYVGVHYPSDILAGMVLGIGIGFLVVFAARKTGLLKKEINPCPTNPKSSTGE
jgi:undecaprenyl-diphosphatase